MLKYFIFDDKLYSTPVWTDSKGNSFTGDAKLVITKEAFLMAYNAWVKGEEKKDENKINKT